MEMTNTQREIVWLIYEITGIYFAGETEEELEAFIKKYSKYINEFNDMLIESLKED